MKAAHFYKKYLFVFPAGGGVVELGGACVGGGEGKVITLNIDVK